MGTLLPYAYPLFRLAVEASRVTAVHNEFMAAAVRAEVPDASVVRVAMPLTAPEVGAEEAAALRARLGFTPDDFVVGSFGLLTPEKQIETVARAVARAAVHVPRMRLLLVGPVPDRGALSRKLEGLGVAGRTVVTGRVEFAELTAHMEAADVAVHLRYPTARETSAAYTTEYAKRAGIEGTLSEGIRAHGCNFTNEAAVLFTLYVALASACPGGV